MQQQHTQKEDVPSLSSMPAAAENILEQKETKIEISSPSIKRAHAAGSYPAISGARLTAAQKLLALRQYMLEDSFITEELTYYVPPNGQSLFGSDVVDPLQPWVEKTLKESETRVVLLKGPGGAGKSTFNRHLLRALWQDLVWQSWRAGDAPPLALAPLFIPLGSSMVDPKHLLAYLSNLPGPLKSFSEEEINVLKADYALLLIADGYDELPGQAKLNLYDVNQLGRYEGRIKLLMTSRILEGRERVETSMFVPHRADSEAILEWRYFKERYLAPFNDGQIESYLREYLKKNQHCTDLMLWPDVARYQQQFAALPELRDLISTPFLLWMAAEVLPSIAKEVEVILPQVETKPKTKGSETKPQVQTQRQLLTRMKLYHHFMSQWFSRQAQKAVSSGDILRTPEIVLGDEVVQTITSATTLTGDRLAVELLQQSYRRFCQTLSMNLQAENRVSVQYPVATKSRRRIGQGDVETKSSEAPTLTWMETLFGSQDPDWIRIRKGCPLYHNHHEHGFLHVSLIDYFVATVIAEQAIPKLPMAEMNLSEPSQSLSAVPIITKPSSRPAAKRKAQIGGSRSDEVTDVITQRLLPRHTLELSADDLKAGDARSQLLRTYYDGFIERSKNQEETALAAANAMTILNIGGVNFSGRDLCRIRIPGADLTGGNFHRTQLREADLSQVNFTGAFLDEADFSGSRMPDIILGERPILKGHSLPIRCMAYDLDHDLAATGSGRKNGDCGVRIWNVAEGQLIEILVGHTDEIIGLHFIPQQNDPHLISLSKDDTIRLWNVETATLMDTIISPLPLLGPVSLSPDGRFLAIAMNEVSILVESKESVGLLGSTKKTPEKISILDLKSKKWVHSFVPYSQRLVSLQWNPVSEVLLLATSGVDDVDQLKLWEWNTECTQDPQLRWQQPSPASQIIFLPDGAGLLTSDVGGVVLRETTHGEHVRLYRTSLPTRIRSITCDPVWQCQYVAAGDQENIEIWDRQTGQSLSLLFGHSEQIQALCFSPKNKLLISASHDRTLRFWQTDIFENMSQSVSYHTLPVTSQVLTPDGETLISGSLDGTVRFWQTNTGALQAVRWVTDSGVSTMHLSEDGVDLYVGDQGGVIHCFQRMPFKKLTTLKTDHGVITALSSGIDQNKKLLFSGCELGMVKRWDWQENKFIPSNIFSGYKSIFKNPIINIGYTDTQIFPLFFYTVGTAFKSSGCSVVGDSNYKNFDLSDTSFLIGARLLSLDYLIYANSSDYKLRWLQKKIDVIEQTCSGHQALVNQLSLLNQELVLSKDQSGHVFIWKKGAEKSILHLILGDQLGKVVVNLALDYMFFHQLRNHSIYAFHLDIGQQSYILAWRQGRSLSGRALKLQSVIGLSHFNRDVFLQLGAYAECQDKEDQKFLTVIKKKCYELDREGDTALIRAIKQGDLIAVLNLLQSKVYIDQITFNDRTALYEAVDIGSEEIVKNLLKYRAGINFTNEHGITPLQWAVSANNPSLPLVIYLLDQKAEVNLMDKDGDTLLHEIALNGKSDAFVGELIKYRADINCLNKNGLAPLHIFSLLGKENEARTLLENKADVDIPMGSFPEKTPLHIAAEAGKSNLVSLLVEYKANINLINTADALATALTYAALKGHDLIVRQLLSCKAQINQVDNDPLRLAVSNGHDKVVACLLDHKANFDQELLLAAAVKGYDKVVAVLLKQEIVAEVMSNALFLAFSQNHQSTVKQLIEHKADTNTKLIKSGSYLHLAIMGRDFEMVTYLLENTSLLNQTGDEGHSPLYSASIVGDEGIFKQLLAYHADVTQMGKEGIHALQSAAFNGRAGIVALLVEHKVEVNLLNNKTKSTALHAAAQVGHLAIVSYLLQKNASINQSDKDGDTALHVAVSNGHDPVIKQLLEKKSDINCQNKNFLTPLDIAFREGKEEVVKYLLEQKATGNLAISDIIASPTMREKMSTMGEEETNYYLGEEKNATDADYLAGIACRRGYGVKINTVEALTYFKQAAGKGHLRAQYYMGVMYSQGEGTEKDPKSAQSIFEKLFTWMKQQAELKPDAWTAYMLAAMYQDGDGIKVHAEEAQHWYRIAIPLLLECAKKGIVTAQFLLGHCYGYGDGVSSSSKVAVHWYRLAAMHGYAQAQSQMGMYYEKNYGAVGCDLMVAESWYRKAIAQGDSWAQDRLLELRKASQGVNIISEVKETIKSESSVTSSSSPNGDLPNPANKVEELKVVELTACPDVTPSVKVIESPRESKLIVFPYTESGDTVPAMPTNFIAPTLTTPLLTTQLSDSYDSTSAVTSTQSGSQRWGKWMNTFRKSASASASQKNGCCKCSIL